MFSPPVLAQVHAFLEDPQAAASLHVGEDFSFRLEEEIRLHQGQIHAENYLLNTISNLQKLTEAKGLPRETLNALLRNKRYDLDQVHLALKKAHGIDVDCAEAGMPGVAVDTANFMRQRASMMKAVLSSTPVLLRDPWQGKPVTSKYGFSDFKAEVGALGFSAIATPRYKGIPIRFAVMKHQHDGYTDNNPAFILSDQFCDAFLEYADQDKSVKNYRDHPLIRSIAKCLKPSIHDRFHNWLLYDVDAASAAFKQWGDDIFFVDHHDKNPLLINYEKVALCFHLFGYQVLFQKNAGFKSSLYDQVEDCIAHIELFGEFLKGAGNADAQEIKESTIYLVLSNICFVLNPYEPRFQELLTPYPDIRNQMLEVRNDGRGIGGILQRLHGYEDHVPSLKYGGAAEAVIEYVLRYPLANEIRARISRTREQAVRDVWGQLSPDAETTSRVEVLRDLPPILREASNLQVDPRIHDQLQHALCEFPTDNVELWLSRIEISSEGYLFYRLERDELDYSSFEMKSQNKRVLLVDVPDGRQVRFASNKTLSLSESVHKQNFNLEGGKDILAINTRDAEVAHKLLHSAEYSQLRNAQKVADEALKLSAMTGNNSVGDLYKIDRAIAEHRDLYSFCETGFYEKHLTKHLAASPGPVVMQLQSGGDQRLFFGAFVYIPFGNKGDSDPDCHLIENTDYKRDYDTLESTDTLVTIKLASSSPLAHTPGYQRKFDALLRTLHNINLDTSNGQEGGQHFI